RESENKRRVRRKTISVFAVKCRKTPGFRAYEQGNVKMCIYYSEKKTTYYHADAHCK
ncbi:hypothetical protein BgiBS90_031908, partial [Biomphalaria glabrata]